MIWEALEALDGRSYVASHVCLFREAPEGRDRDVDVEAGRLLGNYKIPRES